MSRATVLALRHAARFLSQPYRSPLELRFDRLITTEQAFGGQHSCWTGARLLASSAALATAAFAVSGLQSTEDRSQAHCAAEIPLPSANPKGDQFLESFRAWLTKRGCDTDAIEIRACQQVSQNSLFARAQWSPVSEQPTHEPEPRQFPDDGKSPDAGITSSRVT